MELLICSVAMTHDNAAFEYDSDDSLTVHLDYID